MEDKAKLLILYASQTGNAMDAAERLGRKAERRGCPVAILSTNKFDVVHDAGHMVPMDQPKAALEMLKRWTQGSLSGSTTEPESLVSSM